MVTIAVAMQPVGGVNVIIAVPAVIPVTRPVLLTVATPVLPDVHRPPAAPVAVSVVVPPIQIPSAPDIVGAALTVIVLFTAQAVRPVPVAYVITPLPVLTPVTIPSAEPMVSAAAVVLQVPPLILFVAVMVPPRHTALGPPMAAGTAFTVTMAVAAHPAAV
jgi:hypothetical protein